MGRAGQTAAIRFYWGVSPRDTYTPTMSTPASATPGAPLPSVAIIGTDALLAARPATPVQLAHACLAAGYVAAYPATWGDELVAAACARRLATRGDDAAILCACPHVSDALLEVGSDLARFLVPLVPPPVACARYLRALYGYGRVRITYIGACPGAHDPSIDANLTPVQFFGVLTQLGIVLPDQPQVFDSVLPPDRRRFRSLPGGAPTPEHLTAEARGMTLEELVVDDWKTELAQHLITGRPALFDLAPSVGCHCAGARPGVSPADARPAVSALEPPRAPNDVVDLGVAIDLDRTLPFVAPRPRDVAPMEPGNPAPPSEPVARSDADAVDPSAAAPDERYPPLPHAARRRAAAPVVARAAQAVPITRTESGQMVPRAYAARRRTPAEGGVAIEPAPPTVVDVAAPDESVTPVPVDDVVEPTPPDEMPVATPADEPIVMLPPDDPIATAQPDEPTSAPEPVTQAQDEALPVEPAPPPHQTPPVPEPPASPVAEPPPRVVPRSVVVSLPNDTLEPVPPPKPAATHVRPAVIAGTASLVGILVFVLALRNGEGRVTEESSGATEAAPAVLESLPPLPFPMPDTTGAPAAIQIDSIPVSSTGEVEPSTGAPAARESAARPRSAPARVRRPPAPTLPRRASTPPATAARPSTDSLAFAQERQAIRRELEMRRARLDSIERMLDPEPSRRPR